MHRVAANFPDSNIDQKHINRSRGLTRGRAEVLLKRNGLNILPKPKVSIDNLMKFLLNLQVFLGNEQFGAVFTPILEPSLDSFDWCKRTFLP